MRSTSRVLVVSFAGTIVLGAILLALPVSAARGSAVTLVDALFTSTSAVCVTGLTVLDTGKDYSTFGQAVILTLIQVGGLGIMAFSALILMAAGRRIGLGGQTMVEETYGELLPIRPRLLIRKIAFYTLLVEMIGGIILYAAFCREYLPGEAVWLGVFHTVSAFCNAGFGLFSDSLGRYRGDALINLTVMGLIVMGGLGFIVVADVVAFLRFVRGSNPRRLTLHTRVVLLATLGLILGGALCVAVLEYGNTLESLSWRESVLASCFLSVTSRTAGFNTLDTSQLSGATLLFVVLLMIIGGSPGSAAGGVKTTTMVVVGALVVAEIRKRAAVEIRNRRIPSDIVAKALTTVSLFLGAIFLAVSALQITERAAMSHELLRGRFLDYLFEVVSALGTVGLSTGVTPSLSDPGKLLIVICMFLGRLGPLVVAGSLIGQAEKVPYSLPEERIMVG